MALKTDPTLIPATAYKPVVEPGDMLATQGTGAFAPDPYKEPVYYSAMTPVGTVQPAGEEPSAIPFPAGGLGSGSVVPADQSPYVDEHPSRAMIDTPLYAQSPALMTTQPPISQDELMGESWVGRLQPPLGWSAGSYALNTEWDAGSPTALPDEALPGLRDGAFRFSQRLKSQGDQGIIDNLLRQGGSYLEVNQAPYYGDDRPMGR